MAHDDTAHLGRQWVCGPQKADLVRQSSEAITGSRARQSTSAVFVAAFRSTREKVVTQTGIEPTNLCKQLQPPTHAIREW
jgi:hypothetical protein